MIRRHFSVMDRWDVSSRGYAIDAIPIRFSKLCGWRLKALHPRAFARAFLLKVPIAIKQLEILRRIVQGIVVLVVNLIALRDRAIDQAIHSARAIDALAIDPQPISRRGLLAGGNVRGLPPYWRISRPAMLVTASKNRAIEPHHELP